MDWVTYPWDKGVPLMNVEKAREIMEEREIEALVASSAENVFYVSEFVPFHLRYPPYLKGPLVFAILPRDQEPYLVTPHIDIAVLKKTHPSWIKKHVFHLGYVSPNVIWDPYYIKGMEEGEVVPNPVDAFVKVLNQLKIQGTVAIETEYLPESVLQALGQKLPNIKFVDSSKIFRELRSIKSEEEIRRIKRAYEAVEKGIQVVMEIAREGVTEIEIAKEIKKAIIQSGADPIFILLGGGTRGGYNISWPTEYKLKKGDVIRLDLGATYKGYASDAARSIVVGKPSERVKKIISANRRAVEKVIEAIRPGVPLGKLFDIGVNSWKESGFPEYRRGTYIGHGVGIRDHEYPDIRPRSKIRLKPGMVMAIEVPLYISGLGGFNIEDTVLVTEEGYEYIGPYPRIERELIIE